MINRFKKAMSLKKKTLNAVYLLYVFKNQPYSEGKKEINQNKISLSVLLCHFFFLQNYSFFFFFFVPET